MADTKTASAKRLSSFKITLVRPITPETGPIKAEGIVLSRGRRVGTAEGRITDGKGRLLAHDVLLGAEPIALDAVELFAAPPVPA